VTQDGETAWRDGCETFVSGILHTAEQSAEPFEPIRRIRLLYRRDPPTSFRLIRALKHQDSAELDVSELELNEIGLNTSQREELTLTAVMEGTTRSAPIPISLDTYRSRAALLMLEFGFSLQNDKLILGDAIDYALPGRSTLTWGFSTEVPLLSESVAPGFSFREGAHSYDIEYTLSVFPFSIFRLANRSPEGLVLGEAIFELRFGYTIRAQGISLGLSTAYVFNSTFMLGMGIRDYLPTAVNTNRLEFTFLTGIVL